VRRLRDAYVDGWGPDAPHEVIAGAVWVAYVARALSNDEQCLGGSSADIADAQREIVTLLRTWHRKGPLLTSPDEMLRPGLRW
jgi:hypothetical protein